MKKIIILINILIFTQLSAEDNLKFFVNKAIENNMHIMASRLEKMFPFIDMK